MVAAIAALFGVSLVQAHAQTTSSAPSAYAKFTEAATAQRGLFTIWRAKDGSVAFELTPQQFDQNFVELGIPVNGIGEGLFSGITDLQNCQIVRFTRQDNRVAILFPTTRFLAHPGSPEALAVAAGTANSVVGVSKVIAVDDKTGNVVFDASPFLQDVTNIAEFLTELNGGRTLNPMGSYRLDSQQSYFGQTKAFPDNVILDANQTFSTLNPQYIDVPADARNLQIQVQYNIAVMPVDHYMPRLYDDRVGYFVNAHNDFSSDNSFNKDANYIVRWNPDKFPITYYLSNTIPNRYRDAIRTALIRWNPAFRRVGISTAVVVKDQPNDASFDPDDIRYNVIRWLTEEQGGFAEAQLLYNPLTGEMMKSGVVIDSDLMRYGKFDYPVLIQPRTGGVAKVSELGGDDYLSGEQAQFSYGLTATALMNGSDGYNVPPKFANDFLLSIVLHESGHDWGLRHNFIGSEAYTAKELQSRAFTSRYGVGTSVMEYAPVNVWPKGTSNGDYFQTVLGPYDYYAIKWGYARIPGATTPQAELPTLRRWASAW
ncbi:MAG TPA: zinc-dependent metalloprotease, partial [Candidatus Rubrimentiphilum sp.]|nr:zinc-dependent metalloprotease [Candidatus Rubrimentiphilum sp.]